MDVVGDYLQQLRGLPELTETERRQLGRRARAGDPAAREKLITHNLAFAVWMARRYQDRGVPLEDLIQEASLGLMRAVEGYDPERENTFASYAIHHVRDRLQQATQKGRMLRLSRTQIRREMELERVTAELRRELGREPSTEELALAMSITSEEIEEADLLRDVSRGVGSLEKTVGDDTTLGELIEDEDSDPGRFIEGQAAADELARLLEQLPALERAVLQLRYGIAPRGGMTDPLTIDEITHLLDPAPPGGSAPAAPEWMQPALRQLRSVVDEAEGGQTAPSFKAA